MTTHSVGGSPARDTIADATYLPMAAPTNVGRHDAGQSSESLAGDDLDVGVFAASREAPRRQLFGLIPFIVVLPLVVGCHLLGGPWLEARGRWSNFEPTDNSNRFVASLVAAVKFQKISAGNCASIGYQPIHDQFDCELAALELGLADTTAFPTDFASTPEGCYYFEDLRAGEEGLWLGRGKYNTGNGAETSDSDKLRSPICSIGVPTTTHQRPGTRAEIATTTHEAPPASQIFNSPAGASTAWPTAAARGSTSVAVDAAALHGEPGSTSPWPAVRPRAPHGPQAFKRVLKSISYSPVPLKTRRELEDDDFMCDETAGLWDSSGRGDLGVMRQLGANAVRLYGNDPRLNHSAFLHEAQAQGLDVIVGISDFPYIQGAGSCINTNFNCYAQIKDQYLHNLQSGFLVPGSTTYHPAVKTVILMNEPDLKFFPVSEPWRFIKALLSAFDAVLDAEKKVGVVTTENSELPNFTATMSFAVCSNCKGANLKPAIGQMLELRSAMQDPASVGYEARNNLWAAYRSRFINSFNTANPATDIRPLFLDEYDQRFQGTPVFIGEYHAPAQQDQQADLERILSIASGPSTLLSGVSFFEFQVRYDKGGSELMFGMFGLGDSSIGSVRIGSSDYDIRCLAPIMSASSEKRASDSERLCGLIENGIGYLVDTDWSEVAEDGSDPDKCCSKCKEAPRCKSWTWSISQGDQPSQCVLRGASPASEERYRNETVVSGLPPPRSVTMKELPAATRAAKGKAALVSDSVARAFGGAGVDYAKLCPATSLEFFLYA